ncbi:ligand-binding domain of nuclear hormone receptor domain-containing protein [Ditylenchus destructor]|nr:ligand-binding domain of nuclear hormone receptor domain-containing protein [Ditylenchus destructor]
MQAVNNAHLNTNDFEPTTSASCSKALATLSLDTTKTFFDNEYSTFTSSELQNGQLKPTNFARDMETPTKCCVCGHPTKFWTYVCKLNGMCSRMNGINRCRACRFDRCVLVGMNPRAIQFMTSVDVAKFSDTVANRRTGPVFEETIEDKIIQSLVYVELKVQKIRESSRWPSESVRCQNIRELLESNHENVLAHADQYPKELKWPFTRLADIEKEHWLEVREGRPKWITLDMFLCIEMARTMPVFSQLDYNDQAALLKQIVLANTLLLQAFYSHQMKSETLVFPNGFTPTKLPSVYRLKRIIETMKLISCRTMVPISRIQMTMEEFVLLKAIIYSHPAIHGLSERGRVLLEKESIRYSKTLMKHLQSRMGAVPGAKKYAEIISFVGCLFHCAQRLRELYIQGATMPRPLCSTQGSPVYDCFPPYVDTIMYAYFL